MQKVEQKVSHEVNWRGKEVISSQVNRASHAQLFSTTLLPPLPKKHASTMPFTVTEGEEYGRKFFAAFQSGFANNDHGEKLKDFFGDACIADWSDGFKATETKAIFEQFTKTWGFMVNSVVAEVQILADPGNKKLILFSEDFTIDITGGFADEENKVTNKVSFILTLDDNNKVINWTGVWDNAYPPMLAALKKVSARLEESKAMAA